MKDLVVIDILEKLLSAEILTSADIKKALRNSMGDEDIDVCIYAADPYVANRWCLYVPFFNEISELTVEDDAPLINADFKIIDLSHFKIFEKQGNAKIAFKITPGQKYEPLLGFIIKFIFVQFSYNLMYLVRSKTIIQSYRSKDLDTFWHRAINDVALPIINCEAASVFIRDDRTHLLKLRGTSGLDIIAKSFTKRVLKRDVYYLPEDNSWVVKSLKGRQSIYEFENFAPLKKGRFAERVTTEIWSRAYVPMLIRAHSGPDLPSDADLLDFAGFNSSKHGNDYPAGLLRIVNPIFDNPAFGKRHFSWHDKFLIDFIVDVNTVLTRRYMELSRAHDDIEQVCHALGSEVATITRNAEFVRDNLFGSDEFAAIYDPIMHARVATTFKNMGVALNDIKLYVDDIYFQFEKVRKLALDDDLQAKTTDRLFSDVLMKLVNSSDALARIYGRKKVTINNLKDARLDLLPVVRGTAAAWLSVFRNLFENSVKYAKDGIDPEIEIGWRKVDDDFIVITFQDNGPGIPEEERERIFLDGVRGRFALESGQKGTGIGLSYCREVSNRCGGSIELGNCTTGALFQLRMRRAM